MEFFILLIEHMFLGDKMKSNLEKHNNYWSATLYILGIVRAVNVRKKFYFVFIYSVYYVYRELLHKSISHFVFAARFFITESTSKLALNKEIGIKTARGHYG